MDLNYSALNSRITADDMHDYHTKFPQKIGLGTILSIIIFSFVIVVLIFALIGEMLVNRELSLGGLIFFVILVAGGTWFIVERISSRNRLIKLYKFSKENNAQLIVKQQGAGYPGIVFNEGYEQVIREALVFPDGREVGNYTYVTGSGKSRTLHTWGYMRIKLVRRLPHMILDAKKNNLFGTAFAGLPVSLRPDQAMKLEGNFNEFFTLYAPKGYERDALYVFTPDVMSALVDYGATHDIEVVDDSLIFYSKNFIALQKEEGLKAALNVLSKVSEEIIEQGDYYADERIGNRSANIIAESGRRLRTRLGIASILVVVFYLAYVAWGFLSRYLN